jgi:NADP-dependent 3-hydroxy acid dehydrogenase YdfG
VAFLTVTVAPETGPFTAEPLMVVVVTGAGAGVAESLPPPQALSTRAAETATKAARTLKRMEKLRSGK